MIEAIAFGAAAGAVLLLAAGLRRLPWRYAAISAAGWGLAFTALRMSQLGFDSQRGFDAGTLVLIGAIGGAVSAVGWERGERERVRRADSILGARSSSLS